jgi:hypothetical protein
MSNVTIKGLCGNVSRSSKGIPQGTLFTGRIGEYPDSLFLMCWGGRIIGIPSGSDWSGNPDICDYQEVDVTITIEPTR